MAGLTAEQIQMLLGKTRQKGVYKSYLENFAESGEQGVLVPLDSGEFTGKKSTTVKTGFENARKAKEAPEEFEKIRVIENEGQVYLINTALVELTA